MTETDIQSQMLGYLKLRCSVVARINAGMARRRGSWVHLAPEGWSDIIGMLWDGRFLAVEVKRPGKTRTPEQIEFQDQVARGGGVAIVAESLEELVEKVRRAA